MWNIGQGLRQLVARLLQFVNCVGRSCVEGQAWQVDINQGPGWAVKQGTKRLECRVSQARCLLALFTLLDRLPLPLRLLEYLLLTLSQLGQRSTLAGSQ